MTITNRITGIFQLTHPLHCATPDESLKGSMVGVEASTATPTMQQRILTRRGMERIPYFPGNDLRGRLRRKAASIVLDTITASRKVKLELYAGLNCGAVSGKPENDVTIEEVLRARDNVYMGLFGGGTRILRSRFRVADLLPVIASTIEVGAVPRQYGDETDTTWLPKDFTGESPLRGDQLLVVRHLLRVDDVMRVLRPDELEKYIENATAAVEGYQTDILQKRVQRGDDKKKAQNKEIASKDIQKKSDVGNMMSIQAIAAGTPMYFHLDLADDVSDAHVGLMLLALRALVREQALGGWVRTGLGQFGARLSLERDGESFQVFTTDLAGADATLSDEVSQRYVAAANDALASLSAEVMMDFFMPRQAVEEEA
ncbi:type IV CRISPR-associated protein Csf2 [Burkholderia sp. Bp9017]|uniref:type IV CRISPR-associated protein Csf2 n=1 Tax=unclassified Burkholderia TaxID=2613784 RepID=UPI000F5E0DCB|nr:MULTISPECIES: type IV CRISPR-associated protein Csf2 [unclassified Burkholderia]RQZ31661.1 type IV CRISPR-associated protein Csf2 [Burkholderia sp. Bp9017]RQZ37792.1 type IV CRISPR-associated protein Csf2 [Burkholderia sp. Bp9016]